jgi:hypothetical protein
MATFGSVTVEPQIILLEVIENWRKVVENVILHSLLIFS